ncbi:MAG: RNA polymerase sigma factor [Saprospiraceae bacterium]|nr:RNA polymerase sigma factor [Saprospiraceae bacterium]
MNEVDFKHKVFSQADRLYPMVSRMLGNTASAEDAIQEIMLKLWGKRHQVAKHPNIPALVFQTTRNYCIDQLRKRKPELDDASLHLQLIESNHAPNTLEWQDLNAMVRKVLKTLPEQQKEVLILRDLDGYEFVEIAAATQLNIEHVRVLLSRARKKVSAELEKIYNYESGKL